MPLVATQVKRRRGTGVENDAFAGAEGEITVDLTNKELRVHDGSGKLGGFRIGRHTDRSNCITEIPQDIKLELNNGTLTLKAGSKVYVPNGPGVFDEVNITVDKTFSNTGGTGQYIIMYNGSSVGSAIYPSDSGTSTPVASTNYKLFYNTSDNKIYFDTGIWNSGYAFPLALVSSVNGTVTSIDQVFNGFGYIGSTVFALSGVKGLIPNGRNADGTLKSTEFTLNSVKTYTITSTNTKVIRITASGLYGFRGYIVSNEKPSLNFHLWYNPSENIMYDTGSGNPSIENASYCAFVEYNGTQITSFTPKTAFHAFDYNDTEYIAHNAMPSNRYIDLTLGASGTSYTAPVDGYIGLIKEATSIGQYVELWSEASITDSAQATANGQYLYTYIPVSKGVSYGVNYTANGSTIRFRFVYANGAK